MCLGNMVQNSCELVVRPPFLHRASVATSSHSEQWQPQRMD